MILPPDEVLARVCGEDPDDRFHAVLHARSYTHKFLPTLLSHWQLNDVPIGAGLAHECEVHRCRIAEYTSLHAALANDFPGVRQVRGAAVGHRYPAGVLRQQNDLDLAVPSEAWLWAIARRLLADTWQVWALWTVAAPEPHHTVVLTRPSGEPLYLPPDRVELSTRPLEGDYWTVFPRRYRADEYGDLTIATIGVVDELATRAAGARDIYDLQVLLDRVREEGAMADLLDAVARHDLLLEWQRLRRLLERYGLGGLVSGGPRPSGAALRTHRGARRLRTLARPVRLATLAAAHARRKRRSASATRFLTSLQSRLGAARLLASGVPMFGAALDDEASPDDLAELRCHGPYAELATPVGTFALSAGGDIPDSWLAHRTLGRGG